MSSVPHPPDAGSAAPGPFPADGAAIIAHLLTGAPLVGYITIAADGSKAVHPIPITPTDTPDLVADHLAGRLRPRQARTKDGKTYLVSDAVGLAFPTAIRQADGSAVCICISFDIDVGAGHADAYTDEDGQRLLRVIAFTCAMNSLALLCCTSRSGVGFHIHCLLPRSVAARVGVVVAETIRDAVTGAEKVETFPAQTHLREDQAVGKWLALPFGGYADAPQGGRCIAPDVTPADPVFITTDEATVIKLENAVAALHAQEKTIAELQAAMARLRHASHASGEPDDYRDIGLQAIIDRFAEVVDDRGYEAHIVRIRCPTHGGSCLHVAPDQGWYFCHRCRHAGGGPVAPFLLLRLLRDGWSSDQVRAELTQIRTELARNAGGSKPA